VDAECCMKWLSLKVQLVLYVQETATYRVGHSHIDWLVFWKACSVVINSSGALASN
jgi:hypothetical protein